MALITDDMDINKNCMTMHIGGNGDYYLNVITEVDGLLKSNVIRIAMSGGNAPTNVKLAIADLFRALEENQLNEYPD